jgi:hypothetical protein
VARKDSPIRPIVFEAPDETKSFTTPNIQTQRLLGRFLAQDCDRDPACLAQTRDATRV